MFTETITLDRLMELREHILVNFLIDFDHLGLQDGSSMISLQEAILGADVYRLLFIILLVVALPEYVKAVTKQLADTKRKLWEQTNVPLKFVV